MRTLILVALLAAGLPANSAHAGEAVTELQAGAYGVDVRLELPNLQAWAARSTATICVPRPQGEGSFRCRSSARTTRLRVAASDITRHGDSLVFNVRCAGRGAARGHAVFTLAPDGFKGRILMIMGGKNMVMTEVQAGRRIGECGSASLEADHALRSK